jgi:hypothetical protein
MPAIVCLKTAAKSLLFSLDQEYEAKPKIKCPHMEAIMF